MLTSISIIILLGLSLGKIFNNLKLPSLLGYILTGIVLSPYAMNLIDTSLLNIAPQLRQIALVIILTRAGLSLNINTLKKVGRPALLMCFLPACFEILSVIVIGPLLFGITIVEAAIVGSVIAAVSPAIIVPRMINLIEEGYGEKHSIPQLVLAGASVDDVFVIVVFTAMTALEASGEFTALSFVKIPISIVSGIIVGAIVGIVLVQLFKKNHIRDTIKVLIIISISFLLLELENSISDYIPISGLLAIMSMGVIIKLNYEILAERIQTKYNKLWAGAEIMLFVLVGATVNMKYVADAGILTVIMILAALVFRMIGVFVCLIKTELTMKEKIFCMIAYTPKATVQAGIGAVPLAMGLNCGQMVLTIAVMSIIITAPFGAIAIDKTYKKLLK
ncbi:MAG: cation:proton antiporter [Agathobacter sp.]|nr:cation:proton antiporter [Agathobacter sp.]